MKFVIEKNVKMPETRSEYGQALYDAMSAMDVGDSILIPNAPNGSERRKQVYKMRYILPENRQFKGKQVVDSDDYRLWRVG